MLCPLVRVFVHARLLCLLFECPSLGPPKQCVMTAQVPQIHFDKPHFLIPVPKKALVIAQWVAAANKIGGAPMKPVDQMNGVKSGNEESAQAAPADEPTIKGVSENVTTENPDSESESETETVAFAWFCELVISRQRHDAYCELNEGMGSVRVELGVTNVNFGLSLAKFERIIRCSSVFVVVVVLKSVCPIQSDPSRTVRTLHIRVWYARDLADRPNAK